MKTELATGLPFFVSLGMLDFAVPEPIRPTWTYTVKFTPEPYVYMSPSYFSTYFDGRPESPVPQWKNWRKHVISTDI